MVVFWLSKGRWFSVIIFSYRSLSLDLWYSQRTYSLFQIQNGNPFKWSGDFSPACPRSIRKNRNRPDPKTRTYSAQLDSLMTQNSDFTSRLPGKHLDATVSDGYFIHQMPPAVNAQEIKAGLYTQQRNPGIWYDMIWEWQCRTSKKSFSYWTSL